jgi:hypothetical protein
LKQFVDHRVLYSPANIFVPVTPGAVPLPSVKDHIREWAQREVPKSPFSRNDLAKRAGISSASIHRIMGLDETYTATPKWQNVTALAKALGVRPPSIPQPHEPEGMAEPDAEPIAISSQPGGTDLPPTQTEWHIKGMVLAAMGYMPGDHFILDQTVPPANRDCVVAQVVDYETGAAETVLRVYLDGFLVTPNFITDGTPRLFVDGKIVTIAGTITKSWRARPHH